MATETPRGPKAESPRELKRQLGAERSGGPFLQWRAEGALQILLLGAERERVTIGRAADSDVLLADDPEVSRTHAVLERLGAEWALADDGLSKNGSFVNAVRVLGRQRLTDGDRLCLGSTQLLYRWTTPGGAVATQTTRENPASLTLSGAQRQVLVALCRPVHTSESATPATNREIADELAMSVDAVKSHLRFLFERLGLSDLPQNEKRARLAATVLSSGLILPREL